jgi:hypothetical protein
MFQPYLETGFLAKLQVKLNLMGSSTQNFESIYARWTTILALPGNKGQAAYKLPEAKIPCRRFKRGLMEHAQTLKRSQIS